MSVPLPPNEEQRLKELRLYAVLDTPPEKAFDNITELAARIFKTPIASVTLIDEDRQWFKSCVGLETREVGRHIAFCAHAILEDGVMVVPDARADARFADNPLVTGEPHIRFYAGAPLVTSAGHAIGAVCVIDTKPRGITAAQMNELRFLAQQVILTVEARKRQRDAERAQEERKT
jgi:GAF domain-containing protein